MPSAERSPAREASPRHRKRGFIRPSHRTKSLLAKYHEDITGDGDAQDPKKAVPRDLAAESTIIHKLDQKRKELEAQITQYITEKQREYDAFEREVYDSFSERNNQDTSPRTSPPQESGDGRESPEGERGRSPHKETLALPLSRSIWAGPADHPEDRTPAHEREREFHDLFTPFFLPLLDAGSAHRSNSAPPVPNAADDPSAEPAEGYQSDHATRQQVRRAATEPFVKPAFCKKSALRSPKKAHDPKKRVSLIIDDEIVRPSESPKETHIPSTPTEDELMDMPSVTLTDRDGTPMRIFVPEKARLPFPDEDPLDYAMAVGGTMHHAIDLHVHDDADDLDSNSLPKTIQEVDEEEADAGAPLQRFPSDSLHVADPTTQKIEWSSSPNDGVFNMSPDVGRKPPPGPSEVEPQLNLHPSSANSHTPSPPKRRSPSPTKGTSSSSSSASPKEPSLSTSPATSPPASSFPLRHPASYIDKFSTSANRLFGNITDEGTVQSDEVNLAYLDDGGPSASYVGGLSGSGVDNVDIGSAGYPSSLGASYMEQFAAARAMGQRAKHREELEEKERHTKSRSTAERIGRRNERKDGDAGVEEDEFLGEMEGV